MWMWNPNLAGKLGPDPLEIKFIEENLDKEKTGQLLKQQYLCRPVSFGRLRKISERI